MAKGQAQEVSNLKTGATPEQRHISGGKEKSIHAQFRCLINFIIILEIELYAPESIQEYKAEFVYTADRHC